MKVILSILRTSFGTLVVISTVLLIWTVESWVALFFYFDYHFGVPKSFFENLAMYGAMFGWILLFWTITLAIVLYIIYRILKNKYNKSQ